MVSICFVTRLSLGFLRIMILWRHDCETSTLWYPRFFTSSLSITNTDLLNSRSSSLEKIITLDCPHLYRPIRQPECKYIRYRIGSDGEAYWRVDIHWERRAVKDVQGLVLEPCVLSVPTENNNFIFTRLCVRKLNSEHAHQHTSRYTIYKLVILATESNSPAWWQFLVVRSASP